MTSSGCSGACSQVQSTSKKTTKEEKKAKTEFGVFCLTVSDRAATGGYASGDLSGQAMKEFVQSDDSFVLKGSKIVTDDKLQIQEAIKSALKEHGTGIRLILTSGGTGFAPRDVTPEAVGELLVR